MTFPYLAKLAAMFRRKQPEAHHATIPAPIKTYLPRVPESCFDLIRHFESCLQPTGDGRFKAYADPGYGWDLPTIGWGTVEYENGTKVKRGDVITQERADALLQWEVWQKADAVKEMVRVPVSDNQFGALVSFAYNAGTGALQGSTLLKLLNAGDYVGAGKQFARWNKSDGKELDGLTRRRMSEARLFRGEPKFIVTMEEFKRIQKGL